MVPDPYRRYGPSLAAPASRIFLITPSDTSPLPIGVKRVRVVNPSANFADFIVVTVAGDEVNLIIPPQTVAWEDIRICYVKAATTPGLVIHGYSDVPGYGFRENPGGSDEDMPLSTMSGDADDNATGSS